MKMKKKFKHILRYALTFVFTIFNLCLLHTICVYYIQFAFTIYNLCLLYTGYNRLFYLALYMEKDEGGVQAAVRYVHIRLCECVYIYVCVCIHI